MGQEFLETTFDGGADTLLLGIGQESDPPAALRLLADAGRRVPLDLLVIHSDPEDQRKGRLPAVPGRGRPRALPGLLRQPLHDLVLADGIGRARSKHGSKLLDAQTEFVGLFLAVLRFTVLDSVIAKVVESKRPTAKQFGLLLAENRILAPLGKQCLGGAVCAGLFKVPLAIRAGPSNPSEAATLDPLRYTLHSLCLGARLANAILPPRFLCCSGPKDP